MATIIKAIAHLNELTKGTKNELFLRPVFFGTLYEDDIMRRLESKHIAIQNVNGPAFVKLFAQECIQAASEGYHVITSLCRICLGFNGAVQMQDLGHNIPADRLHIYLKMTQSPEARKALNPTSVHIGEQLAASGPFIQAISNPIKSVPDTLNTGSMVLIQGLRLAIRGNKTEQIGVFFTSLDHGTIVHITADQIVPNVPGKLQFVLPPEVVAGKWTVAVATQSATVGTKHIEQVRRTEYPGVITVI